MGKKPHGSDRVGTTLIAMSMTTTKKRKTKMGMGMGMGTQEIMGNNRGIPENGGTQGMMIILSTSTSSLMPRLKYPC